MRIKRFIATLIAAAAIGAFFAPPVQARECLGVRGVVCVGGKQCITDPCYIDP